MDYSLLVGIKRNAEGGEDPEGGILSTTDGRSELFYFGIIDFLQEWDWNKKLERFFKGFWYLNNISGISSVDPEFYAERFMNRAVYDVIAYSDKGESDGSERGELMLRNLSAVSGILNALATTVTRSRPNSSSVDNA